MAKKKYMCKSIPVVVLGLDGAGFKLLTPWINGGKLPTLEKIMHKGAYGDLESVIPYETCPAWKCYSTGKKPDNLGVYWWVHLDWESRRVIPYDSTAFRSPEIWDYINDAGLKTAVITMPTTYPPKKVDGFMIADPIWTPLEAEDYVEPREMLKELKERYNYTLHPATIDPSTKHETAVAIREIISKNFSLLKDSINSWKYSFLNLTFFHINELHHYFWDDEVVRETWSLIDEQIKELINMNVNLIIISDHGESPIEKIVNLNSLLEQNGYIKLKKSVSSIGLRKSIIDKIPQPIKSLIRHLVPSKMIERVAVSSYPDPRHPKYSSLIDWDQTTAIAAHHGPIYINKSKIQSQMHYEEIRDNLIDMLEKLEDPDNGQKVIKQCYKKEELYSGKYAYKAPDLIALGNEGYTIASEVKENIFEGPTERKWRANNSPLGILMAYGPGIKRGYNIKGARLIDVAPTIMHMMGLAIPRDMDGKVLKGVFADNSEPINREIIYREPLPERNLEKNVYDKDEEEVIDRLKQLGYL